MSIKQAKQELNDMTTAQAVVAVIAVILLLAAILIFWPIFAIWSVNTLFGLSIPVTLKTWASAFFLGVFLRGWKSVSKS